MNSTEFVRAIKVQTSDSAIHGTIKSLSRPPGRKPGKELLALSAWFNQLTEPDREMLIRCLRNAAEMAVFEFLCVLDGVAAIEDSPEKGDLELYFVKSRDRLRLNDPKQEELHNIFNSLRQNNTETAPAPADVHPYESGPTSELRSKLKMADRLDLHHVPEKHLSPDALTVSVLNDAIAIALPKEDHYQLHAPR
jgi:hypothetical protein